MRQPPRPRPPRSLGAGDDGGRGHGGQEEAGAGALALGAGNAPGRGFPAQLCVPPRLADLHVLATGKQRNVALDGGGDALDQVRGVDEGGVGAGPAVHVVARPVVGRVDRVAANATVLLVGRTTGPGGEQG